MLRDLKVPVHDRDGSTPPETIAYLLSLANDMRVAGGLEKLDDLPMSEPSNSMNCVIANAFNFNCSVGPSYNGDGSNAGSILFQSAQDALNYLKVTGIEDYVVLDYVDTLELTIDFDSVDAYINDRISYHGEVMLPLTDELNAIAYNFDRGMIFTEYNNRHQRKREFEALEIDN